MNERTDSDVDYGFSIETARMSVSQGTPPEVTDPPRRGRKPKQPQVAQTEVVNAAPAQPKLIRVIPKHGYNLHCHTQEKLIYAGHETQVVRDWWIDNQIKRGILKVVG